MYICIAIGLKEELMYFSKRGTEQHRKELIGTKPFPKMGCMDKLFQRQNEKNDFP